MESIQSVTERALAGLSENGLLRSRLGRVAGDETQPAEARVAAWLAKAHFGRLLATEVQEQAELVDDIKLVDDASDKTSWDDPNVAVQSSIHSFASAVSDSTSMFLPGQTEIRADRITCRTVALAGTSLAW